MFQIQSMLSFFVLPLASQVWFSTIRGLIVCCHPGREESWGLPKPSGTRSFDRFSVQRNGSSLQSVDGIVWRCDVWKALLWIHWVVHLTLVLDRDDNCRHDHELWKNHTCDARGSNKKESLDWMWNAAWYTGSHDPGTPKNNFQRFQWNWNTPQEPVEVNKWGQCFNRK